MSVQSLVVVLLVIGTIGLAFWLRPTTTKFVTQDIAFDYPSDWMLHDQMPATTGPGQILALIGTLPWGTCAESDVNCHFEQRLGPGQIELQIARLGLLPEGGMCGWALDRSNLVDRGPGDPRLVETRYLRIQGRPAIYARYPVNGADYYLSDEWRTWLIAPSEGVDQMLEISAKFRGPGADALVGQLDRLIGSVTLPSRWGSEYPPGGDCGEPFPPV